MPTIHAPFKDAFLRADSSDLGAGWDNDLGEGARGLDIVSNTLQQSPMSSRGGAAMLTDPTNTAAQFIEFTGTFDHTNGSGKFVPHLNLPAGSWDGSTTYPADTTAGPDGYAWRIISFNDQSWLYRNQTSVLTTAVNTHAEDNLPHIYRVEHDGSGEVSLWQDGEIEASYTDGTPLTDKYQGMYVHQDDNGPSTTTVEYFSAGDVGPHFIAKTTGSTVWDNSITATVDYPAGLQAEDTTIIVQKVAIDGSAPLSETFTVTAGVEELGYAEQGTSHRAYIYKATGFSGTGSWSFTLDDGVEDSYEWNGKLVALTYRDVDYDNIIMASATGQAGDNGGGDYTYPTVTNYGPGVNLLAINQRWGYTTDQTGWSETVTERENGDEIVHEWRRLERGATGTVTAKGQAWVDFTAFNINLPRYVETHTDDFNRADEALTASPDWLLSSDYAQGQPTVYDNKWRSTLDFTANYRVGSVFQTPAASSSMFTEATVWVDTADDSNMHGVTVCHDNTLRSDAGPQYGYTCRQERNWDRYRLFRNGTLTVSGTSGQIGDEILDGTVMRITHDGEGFVSFTADGTEYLTYTDGTPLTGAYGNIETQAVTTSNSGIGWDNFSTGDLYYTRVFEDFRSLVADGSQLDTDPHWTQTLLPDSGLGVLQSDQHDDHSPDQVIDVSNVGDNWARIDKPMDSDDHTTSVCGFWDEYDSNSSSSVEIAAHVRCSDKTVGVGTGYGVVVKASNGNTPENGQRDFQFVRFSGTTVTNIGSDVSINQFTPGVAKQDMWGNGIVELEASGDTFTCRFNGIQIGQWTDTTYSTGRYGGFQLHRITTGTYIQPFVSEYICWTTNETNPLFDGTLRWGKTSTNQGAGGSFIDYTEVAVPEITAGDSLFFAQYDEFDTLDADRVRIFEDDAHGERVFKDNFDRADNTVTAGKHWLNMGGFGATDYLGVFNEHLTPNDLADTCGLIYQAPTLTDAQFIEVQSNISNGDVDHDMLHLNITALTDWDTNGVPAHNVAATSSYALRSYSWFRGTLYIFKGSTQLASAGGTGVADDTSMHMRFEHDGNGDLAGYADGTEIVTYTDGSPATGKYMGLSTKATSNTSGQGLTNFKGGDLLRAEPANTQAFTGTTTSGRTFTRATAAPNLENGDALVLIHVLEDQSETVGVGVTVPTGFTLLDSQYHDGGSQSEEILVYTKLITDVDNEPTTYVVSHSSWWNYSSLTHVKNAVSFSAVFEDRAGSYGSSVTMPAVTVAAHDALVGGAFGWGNGGNGTAADSPWDSITGGGLFPAGAASLTAESFPAEGLSYSESATWMAVAVVCSPTTSEPEGWQAPGGAATDADSSDGKYWQSIAGVLLDIARKTADGGETLVRITDTDDFTRSAAVLALPANWNFVESDGDGSTTADPATGTLSTKPKIGFAMHAVGENKYADFDEGTYDRLIVPKTNNSGFQEVSSPVQRFTMVAKYLGTDTAAWGDNGMFSAQASSAALVFVVEYNDPNVAPIGIGLPDDGSDSGSGSGTADSGIVSGSGTPSDSADTASGTATSTSVAEATGAPSDSTDVSAHWAAMPLKAEATGPTSVQLDWSAYAGPDSPPDNYQIWRDGTLIDTISSPTTTYTDNSAAENTTYVYFVRPVQGGA